jgi:hypothetical protein
MLADSSAFTISAGNYLLYIAYINRSGSRWGVFLAIIKSEGAYHLLMNEIRLRSGYENVVRMTAADSKYLIYLILSFIQTEEVSFIELHFDDSESKQQEISG